jgi:hypothetical protein
MRLNRVAEFFMGGVGDAEQVDVVVTFQFIDRGRIVGACNVPEVIILPPVNAVAVSGAGRLLGGAV